MSSNLLSSGLSLFLIAGLTACNGTSPVQPQPSITAAILRLSGKRMGFPEETPPRAQLRVRASTLLHWCSRTRRPS